MEFIKKNRLLITFSLFGALGGFLYWKFVGCISGTCPIKSVWYWSTLYGTLIGFLAGSIVNDIVTKSRKKKGTGHNSEPI